MFIAHALQVYIHRIGTHTPCGARNRTGVIRPLFLQPGRKESRCPCGDGADAVLAPSCVTDLELQAVDLDIQHQDHPPRSDSGKGFSIFANSSRAACATWDMLTCVPSSAARKAAFKAIFRIFPPAIESRAKQSGSSPLVGVDFGNTRCQISAR